MKRVLTICTALLFASSCGYHLGGLKKNEMNGYNTFSVNVFANNTVYAKVSEQLTTALADQMQRDGTYRMSSPDTCDFVIEGEVTRVTASSLTPNVQDTYLSSEIGLTVHVRFTVRDNRTGRKIAGSAVQADGSYFNDSGNVQTARDSALSYATRKAAEQITLYLTTP